jgi:hypothetical protein
MAGESASSHALVATAVRPTPADSIGSRRIVAAPNTAVTPRRVRSSRDASVV